MSGLIYEDDLVQLYSGDYRNHLDMLAGAGVDAVVTDPPYGETNYKWDQWVTGWVDHAAAIAPQLWCFGSFRMFHTHAAEFPAAGLHFAQDVVWEKHNGSSLANDRFRRVHEIATHWYRGRWDALHHVVPTTADATPRTVLRRETKGAHQGERGASAYTSEEGGPKLMRSVQLVRSMHGRAISDTQKPTGIVAPLIEYSVPRGGLVVDLFGGAATTAVAARQSGRRAIVFELRPEAARKAAERLAQQDFDVFGEDGAA